MPGFDYQHPVTGDLFVDRRQELKDLQAHVEGGANILITAPRRMGKSSLIRQAFRQSSRYHGIYVTCPYRATGHDLAEAILAEITLPLPGRLKTWFVEQARRLRPVATLEPDGTWRFTFDRMEAPRKVLAQAVRLLDGLAEKLGKPVVLAIDEVHRILERDKDAFFSLRDVVQFQKQVRYILSGSKYHVLQELLDAENPFGHQLTPLQVGPIPISDFRKLAHGRFKAKGHVLPEATLDRVGTICKGNPKRTQELLFDLLDEPEPSPQDAGNAAIRQVLGQHHLLDDLLDGVAQGNPVDTMVALAARDEGSSVYAHDFLKASGIKTPAHVRSGIQSLQRRGLIDDGHRFVDPYLRIHLRLQDPRTRHDPFG